MKYWNPDVPAHASIESDRSRTNVPNTAAPLIGLIKLGSVGAAVSRFTINSCRHVVIPSVTRR